jgi:type I restriction enzyme M protein
MAQLENIEAIEKRLWKAADTLRGNSELASNEYFLPVMGLIFLRHAYSRFLNVKDDIVANLPSRGGRTRELTKEDFSKKSAIFLKEEAQFDYLITLTDADNRAEAIINAMDSIEADYTNLRNQLPKQEYNSIPNDVLGTLLRHLNPEELRNASGDIFGRIYEYFLTEFAGQGAHDGGEFFTPVSLVQLLVNVIEPDHGNIFDPACGSGGMFVQSAHFMERHQQNPTELTFYGHEKNRVTTRLAKMNLAVHGLEGNVEGGESAITYYNDPHEGLFGNVDYVMANPPFNVDEVDADKIKSDTKGKRKRLPFGLPGVNSNKKVSNANYLWIQYFYSYLNDTGRAGFVMSSQTSSAGKDEAKVREKLVETGDVDIMIDIRGNFFYTRSVPCQLWFLNKSKPAHHQDKVLMIDARNVYRKVTRKIFDFSPEQQLNLTAIVWLYRGEQDKFIELLSSYCQHSIKALHSALLPSKKKRGAAWLLTSMARQIRIIGEINKDLPKKDKINTLEIQQELNQLKDDLITFKKQAEEIAFPNKHDLSTCIEIEKKLLVINDVCHNKTKTIDAAAKHVNGQIKLTIERARNHVLSLERFIEEKPLDKKIEGHKQTIKLLNKGRILLNRTIKGAEEHRKHALEQLKQVRYYYNQIHWLLSRFPKGVLCDVEGLVKLVDKTEIEKSDWSLTPGRYVGVGPKEVDEDFDFIEAINDIHLELKELNGEAVELAAQIALNFEGLAL